MKLKAQTTSPTAFGVLTCFHIEPNRHINTNTIELVSGFKLFLLLASLGFYKG